MNNHLQRASVHTKLRTWHDDGRGGVWTYGEVLTVGPKTLYVRWESGLCQRIHKERHAHLVEVAKAE